MATDRLLSGIGARLFNVRLWVESKLTARLARNSDTLAFDSLLIREQSCSCECALKRHVPVPACSVSRTKGDLHETAD